MQDQVKKIIKEEIQAVLKEADRPPSTKPHVAYFRAKRNLKRVMSKAAQNFPISIRNDDWALIRDYSGQLTVMAKIQEMLEDIDEDVVLRTGRQLTKAANRALNLYAHKISPEFQQNLDDLQWFLERDWSQTE